MHHLTTGLYRVASLSCVMAYSAHCLAAGYGLNENSASYMGAGFAGRASNPVDASIAANNPAGISFVKHNTLSVGSALIFKGGEFEGQYKRPPLPPPYDNGQTLRGKTTDFQKTTPVPFGHLSMPFNDQITVGLSAYGPFGIELDYKDDWPGKYFGDETSVKVINLQGTLSFKVREDFAIGIGLIGAYVKGKLTQTAGVPDVLPIDATIEGDDNTFGWNIGVIWQINEQMKIGAVYHSQLEFTLDGDIKVQGRLMVPENPPINVTVNDKVDAKLDITMPERVALSITHQIDPRWTLVADATWTRWSRFKQFYVKAKRHVKISQSGIPDLPPEITTDPSSYIPMNWKDVWAFSVGTSYQIAQQWLLRLGYMWDQSPVDDKNRTVRSPDANRNWFTCGASWQPTEQLSIDVAYAYVVMDKGNISEAKYNGTPPHNVNAEYGKITGEYNNSSHIVAAQLNYRF
ncbi:OmpP1/FadL family transporter [Endozoicomonas euniceicola]|uniref:Outer membrane protein transport protein n=1 Tax=Endozoicomonas euniceicola TaxID=1234143 RepID=A0ABY6H077_9GAMM|nr:outer membrane protein transport protein [Endozoicomonas euniceicola]UYM18039.1 outer membrane protein transport protein [Endozoicomonas euniceicola]